MVLVVATVAGGRGVEGGSMGIPCQSLAVPLVEALEPWVVGVVTGTAVAPSWLSSLWFIIGFTMPTGLGCARSPDSAVGNGVGSSVTSDG